MTLSATDMMAITEIDGIPSELDAGDPSITDALTSEGVEAGYEGTLVPYMRLEAKREFTELNGGADEGTDTDVKMLRISMENENLGRLIEEGGPSPEQIERYERNEALIESYYRMLIPDDERRAEVLAEAEASADAWEDRIDELLEDAGLNVVDGVIQVDNVVESPRSD